MKTKDVHQQLSMFDCSVMKQPKLSPRHIVLPSTAGANASISIHNSPVTNEQNERDGARAMIKKGEKNSWSDWHKI